MTLQVIEQLAFLERVYLQVGTDSVKKRVHESACFCWSYLDCSTVRGKRDALAAAVKSCVIQGDAVHSQHSTVELTSHHVLIHHATYRRLAVTICALSATMRTSHILATPSESVDTIESPWMQMKRHAVERTQHVVFARIDMNV